MAALTNAEKQARYRERRDEKADMYDRIGAYLREMLLHCDPKHPGDKGRIMMAETMLKLYFEESDPR